MKNNNQFFSRNQVSVTKEFEIAFLVILKDVALLFILAQFPWAKLG